MFKFFFHFQELPEVQKSKCEEQPKKVPVPENTSEVRIPD
jgi:hypothetical protein